MLISGFSDLLVSNIEYMCLPCNVLVEITVGIKLFYYFLNIFVVPYEIVVNFKSSGPATQRNVVAHTFASF